MGVNFKNVSEKEDALQFVTLELIAKKSSPQIVKHFAVKTYITNN